MSSNVDNTAAAPASPSSVLSGNVVQDRSLEPVGVDLTTPQALKLLAEIYEKVKLGIANPGALRFDFGNQELRIRHNTDVLVKANIRSNGLEAWTIVADHEIRRAFIPDHVRFSY